MKRKIFKFGLTITLVLVLLIPSFGIAAAASPDGPPGLQRASEVKEQHENQ